MKQIELGKKIRKLRKDKNLTLEQLAGENFTKGYISQIELGRVKPSFVVLEHIANMLSLNVEELITDDNKRDQLNDLLLKIENDFLSENYDNVILLVDDIKINLSNPIGYKIILLKAKSYFYLNHYKESIKLTKKLVENKQKENKSMYWLEACTLYANSLFGLGLFEESINLYDQSIEYANKHKLTHYKLIANIYLNKATAYQNLNNYDVAIEYYLTLIKYAKKRNTLEPLLDAFIRIGFCYYKLNKLELAKKYLNDGYELNKILDNNLQQAESQLILSYIFLEEKKLRDAELYVKHALILFKRLNNINGIIESQYILAKIYKNNNLISDGISILNELYNKIEFIKINQQNKELIKNIANLFMSYELHNKASNMFSKIVNN